MKKIVFIAGTLGVGGAERQLYYLISALNAANYQVSLITLTTGEFWEEPIRNTGTEIIYLGKNPSRFARIKSVIREVRMRKADIVFSFHFYTNLYSSFAAMFSKSISLGSIRGNGLHEKKNRGKMSWVLYGLPRIIVANSNHGAENVKMAFYKKDVRVLQNVIDLDKFPFCERNTAVEEITLLFVGRLIELKHPEKFIQLIHILKLRGLNVRGVVAGDGVLKESLVAQAEEMGLNKSVEWLGNVGNVQELYRDSHWLVSLSDREGTPNVVLEAMASGIPVASLDYQGIDTLLGNDCGFICRSVEEMADTIQSIQGTEKCKAVTKNARRAIEQKYNKDKIIHYFIELISDL